MRKFSTVFLIVAFAFINSDCKKRISKYPVNMYGVWYSPKYSTEAILEIKKDGSGRLFTINSVISSKSSSGRIKFNDKHFYVGYDKFKFIDPPRETEPTDSIAAPEKDNYFSSKTKKQKVYYVMVIDDDFFSLSEHYQFHKYINY
ncbi:MAG: hypothetical protein IT236_08685 [Bacteroidia bacterium]|nr:hypothetical protein [Bacteroidia bacterium]